MNTHDVVAEATGAHVGSYPSIYQLGHAALGDLFDGPVVIEEKIDGSQISWMVTESGELRMRSKGKQLVLEAPEKMFRRAVEAVQSMRHRLTPGWIYRGEYLDKQKHNALAYSRVPHNHIILFDVEISPQKFLAPQAKRREAAVVGLECVPLLYQAPSRRRTR